jgi:hypothetical protein
VARKRFGLEGDARIFMGESICQTANEERRRLTWYFEIQEEILRTYSCFLRKRKKRIRKRILLYI